MFLATDVYGAAPIQGNNGASVPRPRIVGGGIGSRPAEPAIESMRPANLADDPTFWLVAMFAAASFLALASQ